MSANPGDASTSATLVVRMIRLDSSPDMGLFKADSVRCGWKNMRTSQTLEIKMDSMRSADWIRIGREFCLRLVVTDRTYRFEGFSDRDYENVSRHFLKCFNISVERQKSSVKGWTWGDQTVTEDCFQFLQDNKIVFSIPTSMIKQANHVKGDLTLSLTTSNNSGDAELMEVRFSEAPTQKSFRQGKREKKEEKNDGVKREMVEEEETDAYETGVKKEKIEEDEEKEEIIDEDENEEEEEMEGEGQSQLLSLANRLKSVTSTSTTSDVIASFRDVQALVPRGRFDMDLMTDGIRLDGKSYSVSINYSQLACLFLLPKPDAKSVFIVLSLSSPVRKGNKPYPFIVLQVSATQEESTMINLPEARLNELKLNATQEGHLFKTLSLVMCRLSSKPCLAPGDFLTDQNSRAVSCVFKAQNGFLFPLNSHMVYVHQPQVVWVKYSDIISVEFFTHGNTRYAEAHVSCKSGHSFEFSSIDKSECKNLYDFLKSINVNCLIDADALNAMAGGTTGGRDRLQRNATSNEKNFLSADLSETDEDDGDYDEEMMSQSDTDESEDSEESDNSEDDDAPKKKKKKKSSHNSDDDDTDDGKPKKRKKSSKSSKSSKKDRKEKKDKSKKHKKEKKE